MRSLVSWLSRLSMLTAEVAPAIDYFRVSVAGGAPLDVPNWLFSIDPQGELGHHLRAAGPESWSIIRLPDLPGQEVNIHERHRLSADLACFLSLALDRRVVIPSDLAIHVPELGKVVFHPVSPVVDQGMLGPLPTDVNERLNDYLTAIAGLSPADQDAIGAAASAYHGALLAFDTEPRAAYTLLVAGIEALSQSYGSPPTDWNSWDVAHDWDDFFTQQALTDAQAEKFREKLMNDNQIRLGATFRNYASSRLSDDFWDTTLDHWITGIDANSGQWLPPHNVNPIRIAEVLPNDRVGLSRSLGRSYGLRSVIVHKADWVQIMTFASPPARPLDLNRPLPFQILRAMLASLIRLEIISRSAPVALPNFQLLRN